MSEYLTDEQLHQMWKLIEGAGDEQLHRMVQMLQGELVVREARREFSRISRTE